MTYPIDATLYIIIVEYLHEMLFSVTFSQIAFRMKVAISQHMAYSLIEFLINKLPVMVIHNSPI